MNELMSPVVQAGAMGLCVLFIGVLYRVLVKLLDNLSNDLRDIKGKIDALPCRSPGCPITEKQE